MPLASDARNIRFNGTGRVYFGDVAGANLDDLGELEGLNFKQEAPTDKMYSTRTADMGLILEVENAKEVSLSYGLREMTNENLRLALMMAAFADDNQVAGYVYQQAKTFPEGLYIQLDKLNCFLTKVSGIITGDLAIGDVISKQGGASGKIAWLNEEEGYVELVNVSGVVAVGDVLLLTQGNYITVSGVEKLYDVVITDLDEETSEPMTRYVNGVDYSIDADYGYIRRLPDGTMTTSAIISYDYEAIDVKVGYGMSATMVEKKMVFVTDKADRGPRMRYTFWKVRTAMDKEFPLLGKGAMILNVTSTVLLDTTKPAGQRYYKAEVIG